MRINIEIDPDLSQLQQMAKQLGISPNQQTDFLLLNTPEATKLKLASIHNLPRQSQNICLCNFEVE